MSSRQIISEFTLEPGTGKAIELLKGQILRIEQVEGGQCADFNAFNLHGHAFCWIPIRLESLSAKHQIASYHAELTRLNNLTSVFSRISSTGPTIIAKPLQIQTPRLPSVHETVMA